MSCGVEISLHGRHYSLKNEKVRPPAGGGSSATVNFTILPKFCNADCNYIKHFRRFKILQRVEERVNSLLCDFDTL